MNEVAAKSGRRSREEWLSLMSAYEAGDLSQREFCREQGVAYSTFGYWRKQLRAPAETFRRGVRAIARAVAIFNSRQR
ncbi:MAG: hypothetical protein U5K38_03350 [Woeseiaceae bacterium]|nr:hypothetical protein [Woeseiaceae bacterium]